MKYNHPGLVVDLGVGLWAFPLPMDFDGDGDLDLVVSCPDRPSNGTYFFENPAANSATKIPVFKPGVRIGPGHHFIRVSHIDGQPRVLTPAREFADFRAKRFDQPLNLPLAANIHTPGHKIRANMWQYVDYDGDGALDIVVGVDDWQDYGWDDGYDADGKWLKGPLRGYVYLVRNSGTTDQPTYAEPRMVAADGRPVETFGWPSPNFADFDGDGDLDLLLTANGGPAKLLRNERSGVANVVRVRLIGSGQNTSALGAVLRAEIGGETQTRYVTTGGSYLSQSELTATFGLGQATSVTRLTVRWPDGSQAEFPSLAAGSLHTIQQSKGIVRSEQLKPRS